MSSTTPELSPSCRSCGRELAAGALACEHCDTLVHSEELEQIAAEANALESSGKLQPAREKWTNALKLLPRSSRQADWIRGHTRALDRTIDSTLTPTPATDNNWGRKLGPLGPVAVLLVKSKAVLAAIFKLKFLLSLASFVGVYWALFGAKFGIGFATLILIHEMGHFIDIKRRGLPAEMPVFLPGLGAYVRWQALGVSIETKAAVSLAGPLAGTIAAALCAIIWRETGNQLWAALARASAWLNILNLMPVWVLDGGQAAAALNKAERFVLLAVCIALWLVSGENVFFLVAAGATWRVFNKDAAAHPSRMITAYFVAVLISLALIVWLLPGQGSGMP